MDNNYFGNICYCRKCNGIVHTIKKGDSLYLLSRYYNVPIGEIMNANRHLNIYNLQIGEEICIPMRRSDMLNDNVNNNMSNFAPNSNMQNINLQGNNMQNLNIPDDNLPNMQTTNDNSADNMRNTPMSGNEMKNTPPNIGSVTGDMPGIQMPPENQMVSKTSLEEDDPSHVEASFVSSASETFDKNILMSDLINQEDMTFEKFLSLIQN